MVLPTSKTVAAVTADELPVAAAAASIIVMMAAHLNLMSKAVELMSW